MQGHIREMAALLRGMGRGGDTILAHINPQEAMLLDAVTDGGSINPVTGMPEFFMDEFGDQEALGIGEPGESGYGTDPNTGEDHDAYYGYDPTAAVFYSEPQITTPTDQQLSALNNFVQANPTSQPSLLGAILTSPFETIGNIFGADIEFTGRDVFGPDISRAMAGIDTPQPAGTVEVNPAGAVSGFFGGPLAGMVGSFITPTSTIDSSGNVVGQHGVNAIDAVSGLMNNVPSISRGTINTLSDYENSSGRQMGTGTYNDPLHEVDVSINTIQNPLDPPVETASGGLPPPNINEGDGGMEYFPVGQPVARPEEIADAIIQQQEMARALTMPQPGYTRAGEGLIYL